MRFELHRVMVTDGWYSYVIVAHLQQHSYALSFISMLGIITFVILSGMNVASAWSVATLVPLSS